MENAFHRLVVAGCHIANSTTRLGFQPVLAMLGDEPCQACRQGDICPAAKRVAMGERRSVNVAEGVKVCLEYCKFDADDCLPGSRELNFTFYSRHEDGGDDDDSGDDTVIIGSGSGHLFDVAGILNQNNGWPPLEVGDAISGELEEICGSLFNGFYYKEKIEDELECEPCSSLLTIDWINLLPEGKGRLKQAIEVVANVLSQNLVIALKAFPLMDGQMVNGLMVENRRAKSGNATELSRAHKKVINAYKKAGFTLLNKKDSLMYRIYRSEVGEGC